MIEERGRGGEERGEEKMAEKYAVCSIGYLTELLFLDLGYSILNTPYFAFPSHMRKLISTALSALAMSLLAQWLAEMLTAPVSLLGQFATLRLSHNSGIAFSIALPPVLQSLLIPFALIVVCIVAWRTAHDRISRIGFGLIVGGALANIIDRLPDGLVTDYIAVGTFPVFNLPDTFICIGAGLLLLEEVKKERVGRMGEHG
jgi:signal peptidase II